MPYMYRKISEFMFKNRISFFHDSFHMFIKSSFLSSLQNDFTPEDFSHMTAPLLYSMFKSKTSHPLHAAIRLQREDVVFLFLIEFDSQVSGLSYCTLFPSSVQLFLGVYFTGKEEQLVFFCTVVFEVFFYYFVPFVSLKGRVMYISSNTEGWLFGF